MKLTKEEKNILAIERFFIDFNNKFPNITYMSLRSFYPSSNSKVNTKENIFPFVLYIITNDSNTISNGKSRTYSWEEGSSDDEYPMYDQNNEYYGYYQVKDLVEKLIPEAFTGKSFYQVEFQLDTHNISSELELVKNKKSALDLDKILPINKKHEMKKVKV